MSFFGELIAPTQSHDEEVFGKLGCQVCPLAKLPNQHRDMNSDGWSGASIYALGYYPRPEDDAVGAPFTDAVFGNYLRELMRRIAESLEIQGALPVRFGNIVRTAPAAGTKPDRAAMACCRPRAVADIERNAPDALVMIGEQVFEWVTGLTGVSAWRGKRLPVKVGKHRCWGYPVDSLDEVFKDGLRSDAINRAFGRDLRGVMAATLRQPTPVPPEFDFAEFEGGLVMLDEKATNQEIASALAKFKGKEVAFDIECVAGDKTRDKFRPYGRGNKIVSIAFSDGDYTVALPVSHRDNGVNEAAIIAVIRMLFRVCDKLIAHNLEFDLEWVGELLCRDFADADHSWRWACTLAQAYVIDNRSGGHSLGALTQQYFGVNLKEVIPVNFAQLEDEPMPNLLKYNGLDAWFTKRLFDAQRARINRISADGVMQEVLESQWRRIVTATHMSLRGLVHDAKVAADLLNENQTGRDEIIRQIGDLDEVKRWSADTGQEFKVTNTRHLVEIATKYLGLDLPKTAKGNSSASAQALEKIDHPLFRQVVKLRALETLRGTFLEPLQDDGKHVWADGRVHPRFNTCRTITRRLSSSSPNGQNFPKRAGKHIRNLITAPPGHQIVSIDYGQMEARFIAADSQDGQFVNAVVNGLDIHQHWADRIAEVHPSWSETDAKERRNLAKGGMVFASFYKASTSTIARACKIPKSVAEQLLGEFWQTYSGVEAWHGRLIDDYCTKGYIELVSGFRCRGVFTIWETVNYRVQGSSSDIVVNAMNRLFTESVELDKPQYAPILNIHDDLTFYLPNETFDADVDFIAQTMLKHPSCMRQIPLLVEIEAGESWGSQKEIAQIEGKVTADQSYDIA